MASRTQIETEALNRGRLTPPPPAPVDDRDTLADAQRAQLDRAEELVAELRARLAEKDVRIAQLERQLSSYARSMADVLASA